MNKLDAIGRRKRFVRKPTGKRVGISPRILLILEKLHWYGDLPTEYLYQFTKHLPRSQDRTGLVKLLGDMFHERTYRLGDEHYDLPQRNGLIDRPHQQLRADNPLGNEMVHAISDQGLELLKHVGRHIENAFQGTQTWEHRVMQATVMASIELGTLDDPELCYIPQHKIIGTSQPIFNIDGVDLKPDGLCALERGGRRIYLLIECDRDTEANRPRNERKRTRKGKYWIDTVRLYRRFVGDKLYKQALGTQPNGAALVLNVTTNAGHMMNQVDVIEELCPQGNSYILSQYYPCFATSSQHNFTPPPVLPLLSAPWKRAGNEDFVIIKK